MNKDGKTSSESEEFVKVFQSDNIPEICRTLVELALSDPDWRMVEGYCLQFLEYPDAGVRMVSATCIGHLARIHQQLDLDLVLPALYRHQSDTGQYVAGTVDNALSSIERFMQVPVERDPARRGPALEEVEHAEGDEAEDDEDESPPTAEEVAEVFSSQDESEITRVLLGLALYDPDWRKTEAYCLQFLEHASQDVRGMAVQCLSRLLYIHKQLDLDLVLPALYRHRSDPSTYVVKQVGYALHDIATVLNVPIEPIEITQDKRDDDTKE